jgi:hypothetical protein
MEGGSMNEGEYVLLQRLVDAQERIAAADERRNELLEEDQRERRETWAKDRAEQAERWREMNEVAPDPERDVEPKRGER